MYFPILSKKFFSDYSPITRIMDCYDLQSDSMYSVCNSDVIVTVLGDFSDIKQNFSKVSFNSIWGSFKWHISGFFICI